VARAGATLVSAAAALLLAAGPASATATVGLAVPTAGLGTGCATPISATVPTSGAVKFYDNGKQATFSNPVVNANGTGVQTVTTAWKPLDNGQHTVKAVQGNKEWTQTVNVATGLDLGSACLALPTVF
jgi:hypothetical protein